MTCKCSFGVGPYKDNIGTDNHSHQLVGLSCVLSPSAACPLLRAWHAHQVKALSEIVPGTAFGT